jgi:hypothetical protein
MWFAAHIPSGSMRIEGALRGRGKMSGFFSEEVKKKLLLPYSYIMRAR